MLDPPQMLDQPQLLHQRDSGSVNTMTVWLPVIGASVVIAAFGIAVSAAQISQPYPHDPWESIIIADAYRASAGLPVYTNPDSETGHATHIYGPLMIYTVGLLFKLTGINPVAAHVVPLIATIWIIAAGAAIYFRRIPWIARIAGVSMLIGLNVRLRGWFTQLHPDMPAMGFSVLALILMFQAMEKRRWACLPLALGSFCVAYLFKQTFAMFTIVPLLSLLLLGEWTIGTLLAVVAPPATVIGLIVALYIIAPHVHYHMITAVSRWPVRFDVLAALPLRFLGFYILLPVALSLMILIRPGIRFGDPKIRWLIAAGVGALPGGFLQYAKAGGGTSGFMPALIPLMVLSTLGIVAAWEATSASVISPARARAFACLIALVMMVDGVETSRESLRLFVDGHGDKHYPQVVEHVRKLEGRVVCPDDPTIPIVALGQTGRSYWAESDTHFAIPMPGVYREISSADYVIVVNSQVTKSDPDILRRLGFVPASWGGADMGVYELWRKRLPGEGDNGSRLN